MKVVGARFRARHPKWIDDKESVAVIPMREAMVADHLVPAASAPEPRPQGSGLGRLNRVIRRQILPAQYLPRCPILLWPRPKRVRWPQPERQ